MKIPTYSGSGKNQCLPHAFAALTGGNGDHWTDRLGYDWMNEDTEYGLAWRTIARGIPSAWLLLYNPKHTAKTLLAHSKAARINTLPPAPVTVGMFASLYKGDSVVVVRSRHNSGTHALAVRHAEVYNPDDDLIYPVSRFSRKHVLYAWHKEVS